MRSECPVGWRSLSTQAVDEPPHRLEPVAIEPRYEPPRSSIHPDRDRAWLRRLWPVVAGHRGIFAGALLASAVSLLCGVAVPRIMMGAIDTALSRQTTSLEVFVLAIAGLGIVRGAAGFLSRFWLFRVAYAIENDLRVTLYEHLTRMSFSFYDRVQSGQLISRANSDIRTVQMFLTFGPLITLTVLSFLGAVGLMLSINVPLTIVAVLPLPFVGVLGARLGRQMFPMSWIVQARMAEIATLVEENLSGVRVVKAFAAEAVQIGTFAQAAHRLQWINVRQAEVQANHAPVIEAMPRVGMALVLLVGGGLAIQGQITIGAIVAFTTYVVMLQAPFRMFGFFLMMMQRAAASAVRIYEVLDEDAEIHDRDDARDLEDPRGEVWFDDVTFGYGDGPSVLRGFDLRVAPGETVAVVGRTGCGKSTVARLLARFYDPDGGAVRIDGSDLRELTLASVRAHVGIVPDEPFLFAASIRENIAYARPDAAPEEVEAAAQAAGAAEFIEKLPEAYDTEVGERGYDLSGGQRQRISIARSLLANPRVLVLDDATSAVDVQVEQSIHDALERLLRERTTIVIAHRLSTIALADRVVLLEGGSVVADGTHADLMRDEPRYAEVLAHFDDEPTEPAEEDVTEVRP